MLKVTIIPNAKATLTAVSTMCMSASAAIVATLAITPKDWIDAYIPKQYMLWVVLAVLLLGIVGRFLQKIEANAPQEVLSPVSGGLIDAPVSEAAPVEEKPLAAVVSAAPAVPVVKES